MRFRERFILLGIALALSTAMLAAPIPFFRNYTPVQYGAMSQNWALAQDRSGYIYVGNNSCLLRYNGKSWERFYPLGEHKESIIRSLYADPSSDRIYLGSFREFGYLEYDPYGNLLYTSLYQQLEAPPQDNEEIWYITRHGNQVFFIYFTSFYIYDTVTGALHREVAPTSYFYEADGALVLSSSSGQARCYGGETFDCANYELPSAPQKIVKLFHGAGGTRIAVSASNGLYQLGAGQAPRRIDSLKDRWDVANRAIQCADSTIVVGFLSGGVYAFSPSGENLWHIGTGEGLLDNTVLSLMEDRCGNIWCALDKGLAVIFKGGDRLISLSDYHLGKISVSLLEGDQLLVGSNQGLSYFRMDKDALQLQKVASFFSNSPLWSLAKEEGAIFVGENGGEYLFHEGTMRHLCAAPGGTSPKLLTLQDGSEVLIQGSFTNLYVYRSAEGEWHFSHTVQGLMAPVRKLEVDYLGNVWLERMYEGLQRVRLSGDGHSITETETFFEDGTRVCKMGGRVLFHNKDGFWFFDDQKHAMEPFAPLNQLSLGDCKRVIPVGTARYWLVRQDDAVLIDYYDGKAQILDRVGFRDLGVSLTELFESIIPITDTRFLFGVENGFLVHDVPSAEKEKAAVNLFFSGMSIFNGKSLTQVPVSTSTLVVPYNHSFSLRLCAGGLKYQNAQICYQLSSFDYEPHVMGPEMTATYAHMPSGTYTFNAWLADEPSRALTLTVHVKPSFFASAPAVIFYFLLAAGLCFLLYGYLRRALRRQRMRLEQEKEKELLALRNEQLEASLLLKSKELATYSLLEAGRNQVLQKLRTELSRIRYDNGGNLSKRDYDLLQSIIRDGEFSESSWEHFYTNFDLIHKSFFRTLLKRHPELSTNDLRICAYLRLNLSTKELADIMGITLKGAEAAKYRLRKKLSLDSSVSISEYLLLVEQGESISDYQ
ncbi:MAG: hypothetical protein J6M31_00330 [Bacteroidales bacterium]|nr:hypothetical protein [Bacteroidales bacterium]